MNNKDILLVTFFIILAGIGYYFGYSNSCNSIEGLLIRDANYTEVKDTTKFYDQKGDWVCANVEGMSFKRCVEVASHECGHELFAEMCERNKTKCEELI